MVEGVARPQLLEKLTTDGLNKVASYQALPLGHLLRHLVSCSVAACWWCYTLAPGLFCVMCTRQKPSCPFLVFLFSLSVVFFIFTLVTLVLTMGHSFLASLTIHITLSTLHRWSMGRQVLPGCHTEPSLGFSAQQYLGTQQCNLIQATQFVNNPTILLLIDFHIKI